MTAKHTPWAVITSPTDPEMFGVGGAYLVAINLPIEDARLIAAAPDLLAVAELLVECGHEDAALVAAAMRAIASVKGEA